MSSGDPTMEACGGGDIAIADGDVIAAGRGMKVSFRFCSASGADATLLVVGLFNSFGVSRNACLAFRTATSLSTSK